MKGNEDKSQTIVKMMTAAGYTRCTEAAVRSFINNALPYQKVTRARQIEKNKVSTIIKLLEQNGAPICRATKSKRKKIIYASRWAFTRGIWRRGYRAYHYEPASCPNSPYWLSLNTLPPALDGRFILFEGVHNYAIYENMNRIISLSKTPVHY